MADVSNSGSVIVSPNESSWSPSSRSKKLKSLLRTKGEKIISRLSGKDAFADATKYAVQVDPKGDDDFVDSNEEAAEDESAERCRYMKQELFRNQGSGQISHDIGETNASTVSSSRLGTPEESPIEALGSTLPVLGKNVHNGKSLYEVARRQASQRIAERFKRKVQGRYEMSSRKRMQEYQEKMKTTGLCATQKAKVSADQEAGLVGSTSYPDCQLFSPQNISSPDRTHSPYGRLKSTYARENFTFVGGNTTASDFNGQIELERNLSAPAHQKTLNAYNSKHPIAEADARCRGHGIVEGQASMTANGFSAVGSGCARKAITNQGNCFSDVRGIPKPSPERNRQSSLSQLFKISDLKMAW